ncbi:MAG: mechanosensitive ion channel family protein [Gammaproteobacteria bacterium]|nr:mechanosensitive ion channel family protein [Gammaproteobacteria bacterium]
MRTLNTSLEQSVRAALCRLALLLCLSIAIAPAAAQMVPPPAAEQTAIEVPQNLTRAEVRDLVARLSDDQVRELVIRELDKNALAAEQATDATLYLQNLNAGVSAAKEALTRMFDSREQLHDLPAMIWAGISDNGAVSGAYLLFQLIGLIVAGFAAEYLARRLLERTSKPTETLTLGRRFDLACYGAVMGLIELGAFAIGAFLFVGITAQHTEAAAMLWHEVIWCLLLIKLVLLGVRQLAAPANADTRLMSIGDTAARQIWGWALVLSSAIILPQPIVEVAEAFGASQETLLNLGIKIGLVFVILLVALIYKMRDYGRQLIAGDGDSGVIRQNLARVWWILSIGYVLIIWLMSIGKHAATGESTMLPGLASLLLFVSIPYLDRGLKALITWYFEKPEEEPAAAVATSDAAADTSVITETPADEAVVEAAEDSDFDSGYHATALRYARVLMVLALLGIFVRLWNIDLEAITGQLVSERFASALFDIGITVLLAWALWGVIRISIERKLEDERGPEAETEEAEAGGLGGTRTETILPLIRAFIKITLIVMTVLISLSSLGVNIGPLIAGAGVVGIAIGFGAQTLVRDIVSGFFYLLDDAFRIGEYVVIDQTRGTVERISIRSFQLRHHEGPVHTIPYGEIRTLTNWSRDWAIMKCEIRVPFETDIEKVRKLIKKIGIEMMEDPQWGPLMLAPVKSQGVNRMDDSALIIRFKFTAVPGQQYLIRREAFVRIQRAFEANGIQFAPRRVLVEATTPQEAVKAASAVIDQEETAGDAGQNPATSQP